MILDRGRWTGIVLAAALPLLGGGCRSLTGELFLQPVEKDLEQGAEYRKVMEEQVGMVRVPELEAYVKGVGERIVSEVEDDRFRFSFEILDQDAPNAFALPGGPIFVSRGLLALAIHEDEIATVLGHEAIHVTRRHTAARERKGLLPSLLTLPGRAVGHVVSDDLGKLINSPIETVGAVFQAKYSRGQESESDALGLELAAKAGYEPEALAAILARMEREGELRSGGPRRATFFDSHPSTPSRVADIRKRSEDLEREYGPRKLEARAPFVRRLDGLVLGENPANGVFQGQKFLHPDLDLTLTFPKGWRTVNTPTAVGAAAPEGNAVAFLGIHGEGGDPAAAAKAFVAEMGRDYGLRPSRSEAVAVGEWPGHVVTFSDVSVRPAMDMHILWFARGGTTYQMIGLAPGSRRAELREIVMSLRPLTAEERRAIRATRLRVVEAREGETLEEVAKRVGSVWSEKELELYNGMSSSTKLRAGDVVKVASSEPYRTLSM